MKNSICAIIVTYQIGKDLLKCLNSVKDQVQETVIVDNGSDAETVSVLKEIERTCNNVKVIYNRRNLGIAVALNVGVRYALDRQYKWVLTMDHDSEAAPGMVESIIKAYDQLAARGTENIGIIAASFVDRNVQTSYGQEKQSKQASGIEEVLRCISSGSMINCAVFKKVGFFNEHLFMYYVDDDFCLRCKDKNWRIYISRAATFIHSEGRRQIKKLVWKTFIYRNYDFLAMYYMARNGVYMLKKHFNYPRYCWGGVIKHLCNIIITMILFSRNRTTLIRYTLKGIWHGITGRYGMLVEHNRGK
jgi:rhamnosyltransferase